MHWKLWTSRTAPANLRRSGLLTVLQRPAPGARHAGLPVFWIDEVPFPPEKCYVVAGIVSTRRRQMIETMQSRGYRFTSVIHPSAVISRRSLIGEGCAVNAGVVVSQSATVEPHVILNRGALIGHDVRVGSFSTVGPGANIAGGTQIGAGVYIGAGAVILDHLKVGTEALIAAGAVVTRSVPANSLAAGSPARVIKKGVKGL
jgi:acetyltransferase EpsM